MAYEYLAYYYDELMEGLRYSDWIDLVKKYATGGSLLDVACGSGTITIGLAVEGFDVTAFDISPEMINVLDSKVRVNHVPINYELGDMRHFNLNRTFDVVTIFVDSINYLTDEEELLETMKNVYRHLEVGGYCLFDVHTENKIDNQFDGYVEELDMGDYQFLWKSEKLDETHVKHHFEFDVEDNHYEEDHFQTIFSDDQIKKTLNQVGLVLIDSFEKEDRRFYVSKKEK